MCVLWYEQCTILMVIVWKFNCHLWISVSDVAEDRWSLIRDASSCRLHWKPPWDRLSSCRWRKYHRLRRCRCCSSSWIVLQARKVCRGWPDASASGETCPWSVLNASSCHPRWRSPWDTLFLCRPQKTHRNRKCKCCRIAGRCFQADRASEGTPLGCRPSPSRRTGRNSCCSRPSSSILGCKLDPLPDDEFSWPVGTSSGCTSEIYRLPHTYRSCSPSCWYFPARMSPAVPAGQLHNFAWNNNKNLLSPFVIDKISASQ